MARGIDRCAHGCIGGTHAHRGLAGSGVDVIYLKENKKLAEDILATGGAIVSEVQMGTALASQNFPQRNRIFEPIDH
jgi:DNA processing protein